MMVVRNASPLVNLSRINRLALLKSLYGSISIPTAVYNEVVVAGKGLPGANAIAKAEWINVKTVSNVPQVRALKFDLDPGEAESIVLAIETNAALLIMDERIGRDMARHLGLMYTGTIGCLIEARKNGIIDAVRPILEDLRTMAGFRIRQELFDQVLKIADE